MHKVTGIGGIFFRSADPDGLARWYQKHLGIDLVPQGPGDMPWMTEAGATVFSPFAADSDYFAAEKSFMLNFRVDDLDGIMG